MAHLLRLPANTVSRALAAIYSPGKHHVLTDAPHFFSIHMSPEKIRIESEPSNQPVESLYLFHLFQNYIIAQIALVESESGPVIKVLIPNMAPVAPIGLKMCLSELD
jgi:hypothetical protein